MVQSNTVTVEVSTIATALSISAWVTDDTIAIEGFLTRVDTGEGIADRVIIIYITYPNGLMAFWEFARTEINGRYFYQIPIEIYGTFAIYSEFPAVDPYSGCISPTVYLDVPPPVLIPTALSVAARSVMVNAMHMVRITGFLTRPDTGEGVGGKYVTVHITFPDGSTQDTKDLTYAPDGHYGFDVQIAGRYGTWTIYSDFPGDETYAGCEESVPLKTERVEPLCPQCKQILSIDNPSQGKIIKCSVCNSVLELVLV